MNLLFCRILTSLCPQVSRCEELVYAVLPEQVRSLGFSPIISADLHINKILTYYATLVHNRAEKSLKAVENPCCW